MLLSTVVARTMEWSNRSTELNAIKPAFDVTPSFSQHRATVLSRFASFSLLLSLFFLLSCGKLVRVKAISERIIRYLIKLSV